MFVFRMKTGFHWRVVGFTRFNFKSAQDCFFWLRFMKRCRGKDGHLGATSYKLLWHIRLQQGTTSHQSIQSEIMLQARAFEKGQNLLQLRFSWPIKLRIFPHETTSWRDRLGCRRFQLWCFFCRNGLFMSQFKLRSILKKCRKWFF